MKLKTNEVIHIGYTKATNYGSGDKGEVTERYVIPTFVPQPNIKALDVTALTSDERDYIQNAHKEYADYIKQAMSNLHSFENWLEMTTNDAETVSKLKWRTFKTDNVTLLD